MLNMTSVYIYIDMTQRGRTPNIYTIGIPESIERKSIFKYIRADSIL